MNHRHQEFSPSLAQRLTRWVQRPTVSLAAFSAISLSFVNPAQAEPKPEALSPTGARAPHPKHCLDERQWRGASEHHPLNLFDVNERLWVPCELALRDPGYSVTFPLAKPVELDGFVIQQALIEARPVESKRGRRKGAEAQELPRKRAEKVQLLFFNTKLSERYPIYFHEVHFEGQAEVSVRYEESLDWNPILLREGNFDERRRALGLPATELKLPLKVDAIGVVFWERHPGEAPTALERLTLTRQGAPLTLDLKGLEAARARSAQLIEAQYRKSVEGLLLIGEARSLSFAKTGTLWGMEGEEESPKVMGRWRSVEGRVEIALGSLRSLKAAERRNRLKFEPLQLIIDEAPDRLVIKEPRIGGDYQVASMKPHPPPKELLEAAGQGAKQGKPVKLKKRAQSKQAERAPSFEPEGW